MESQLKKLHKDFEVTLCGAYRRKDDTILGIVAVITHRSRESNKELMAEVVDTLKKNGTLVEVMTQGENRLKGIMSCPAVLDRKMVKKKMVRRKMDRRRRKQGMERMGTMEGKMTTIITWRCICTLKANITRPF